MSEKNELKERLLNLMRDAVERDKKLREEYQMGDKFRFVRDRLQALQARVEENVASLQKKIVELNETISENEVVVYVYLYNAHGLTFSSWLKMLNPSVFYEYSVNRPVYADKTHVDAYIRSKTNKVQHGYLSIIVDKKDILESAEVLKDSLGHSLIKIREGTLKSEKLLTFTHGGNEYKLNANGELVKKKSDS